MKKQLLLLLMMLLPMLASAFEIIEVDGIYYQIFDDMNNDVNYKYISRNNYN